MKLLVFAHRGEAQAFLSAYDFKAVDFFFTGLLRSQDYFLLICGEGPQSASEKTIATLSTFHLEIDHVYNFGVAGSLNHKCKLHDLFWVRSIYAHHAEKLEFKSFTTKNKEATYDCMTAYSRVLNSQEKKTLSHFASLVDRELWTIASAATLFKIPFDSLKIVSDEMSDIQGNICQFVKDEAPLFSSKLLEEFKRSQTSDLESDHQIIKTFTNSASDLLADSSFYFTTSQERKLTSLLENLTLKGFQINVLLTDPYIGELKSLDILPKERTRNFLQFLNDLLNPISVKIRSSLEKSLNSLHVAKIQTQYDSDFEESWLQLSMRIQSSRDLEKIKNALKIFSYEDYKNIFDGKF